MEIFDKAATYSDGVFWGVDAISWPALTMERASMAAMEARKETVNGDVECICKVTYSSDVFPVHTITCYPVTSLIWSRR